MTAVPAALAAVFAFVGVGGAFLTVWCAGCAHGYRIGHNDGRRAAWRADRHRTPIVRARLAAEQDRADIAAGRGWHPDGAA